MSKYYMITDMSQLPLIKEHILQRKVDLNPFRGSYLHYTLFHPSIYMNREGYKALSCIFKGNNNKLYFDYNNGAFYDNYHDGEDEVVTIVTERYTL